MFQCRGVIVIVMQSWRPPKWAVCERQPALLCCYARSVFAMNAPILYPSRKDVNVVARLLTSVSSCSLQSVLHIKQSRAWRLAIVVIDFINLRRSWWYKGRWGVSRWCVSRWGVSHVMVTSTYWCCIVPNWAELKIASLRQMQIKTRNVLRCVVLPVTALFVPSVWVVIQMKDVVFAHMYAMFSWRRMQNAFALSSMTHSR